MLKKIRFIMLNKEKTGNISRNRASKIKLFFLPILMILLFFFVGELFFNSETIKTFILRFGIWAPLIVIVLQILQSMVSVIPSQITTIVAGFLFGPVLGLLYALIGATIGSSAIFLISRRFGQKLALKFFSLRDLSHFEAFFKQKKSWALFLARIAPIFPNDLVSIAGGLTNISFGQFTALSTLGFIAQMAVLVLFGSQLAEGSVNVSLIIISVLAGILLMIVLFKEQIRRMVIKDLHKVEKSLKQGVKIVF